MLVRIVLLAWSAMALAQSPSDVQRPKWQPAWPCTGKEPSFDQAFAKTAEATGGQLFLFDRSEAGRSLVLVTATTRHPETVIRAAGKLEEPYRDFRVPVDPSIDSLLVSVSLQCMQRITIYGPSSAEIQPEQLGGENHWFRAGRVAMVPKPEPGLWTIRLQGAGPFFLAVQARTSLGLRTVKFASGVPHQGQEDLLTLSLNSSGPNVRFSLVNAAGETLQPLVLQNLEGQPGIFSGSVIPGFRQFRILAEGTDDRGYAFERMDPRLMEAAPGTR